MGTVGSLVAVTLRAGGDAGARSEAGAGLCWVLAWGLLSPFWGVWGQETVS